MSTPFVDALGNLFSIDLQTGAHPAFPVRDALGNVVVVPASAGLNGGGYVPFANDSQPYPETLNVSTAANGGRYVLSVSDLNRVITWPQPASQPGRPVVIVLPDNPPPGTSVMIAVPQFYAERCPYHILLGKNSAGQMRRWNCSQWPGATVMAIWVTGFGWAVMGDADAHHWTRSFVDYEYFCSGFLPAATAGVIAGMRMSNNYFTSETWGTAGIKSYRADVLQGSGAITAPRNMGDNDVATTCSIPTSVIGNRDAEMGAGFRIFPIVSGSGNQNIASFTLTAQNSANAWHMPIAHRMFGRLANGERKHIFSIPCIEFPSTAGQEIKFPLGRQYRCRFTQISTALQLQIAELTFKDAGGVDMRTKSWAPLIGTTMPGRYFTNTPVTARAGITVAANSVQTLHDGSAATFYEADLIDSSPFVGLMSANFDNVNEFAPCECRSIDIRCSTDQTRAPLSGAIEYSDDGGLTWVTSWTWTTPSWTSGELKTFSAPADPF